MITCFGCTGVNFSNDIVKAGNDLSFQLAGWLRVLSEDGVLHVLVNGLKGRWGEGSLENEVAWNILDLEFSLVGENLGRPVFGIGRHLKADNGRVSIGWVAWEAVMISVSLVDSLGHIAGFVDVLLKGFWQVVGPLEGQAGSVESSSLLNGNGQAVVRNGESSLLVLFALLSLWGLGLGPFSHVLSTFKFTVHADLVLLQVFVFAGVGELSASLNLDLKFVVEEGVAESDGESWVSEFGVLDLGADLGAEFVLLSLVVGVDDGLGKLLDRVGVAGETASSFLGGGTLSVTTEELVSALGKLEDELLLVGVFGLEEVDQTLGGAAGHWLDFLLLGQNGENNETSLLEDLS